MPNDWEEQGGAAFPVPIDYSELGMAVRDWFAGQALAAIARDHNAISPERMASIAYELADAMLERGKRL